MMLRVPLNVHVPFSSEHWVQLVLVAAVVVDVVPVETVVVRLVLSASDPVSVDTAAAVSAALET